jgi:DUF4097 and DUF4098 domain-containing protein YvlB
MRSPRLTAVLAAFALAAAPAIVLAQTEPQTETETVERTLRLPQNGMLTLKNFSGDVRISASGGSDVVIKAVRRATRDRLDHIKLEITESGSGIGIEANKRDPDWTEKDNNVVETEFDIQVPAAARLDVHVFSSDVTVRGVTGDQTLETFSGDVIVEGARGALDVKSFNGDIDADLRGAGSDPDIRAETFSGRIEARLADNARGRLEFASFSGSFDSDLPLANQTKNRRSVRADLPGGAGDTLRFKTFSGQLRILR